MVYREYADKDTSSLISKNTFCGYISEGLRFPLFSNTFYMWDFFLPVGLFAKYRVLHPSQNVMNEGRT